MRNRRTLFFLVPALAILCCVVSFAVLILVGTFVDDTGQADLEVLVPLREVCDGQGIAEAAAYTADTGVHPTLVIRPGPNRFFATDDFPENWRPQTLADAELVACLEQEELFIERCAYDLFDSETGEPTGEEAVLERIQPILSVTLREAQTGRIVESTKLEGGMPRECQDEESFNIGNTATVTGEAVTDEQVLNWLRPYVEVGQ